MPRAGSSRRVRSRDEPGPRSRRSRSSCDAGWISFARPEERFGRDGAWVVALLPVTGDGVLARQCRAPGGELAPARGAERSAARQCGRGYDRTVAESEWPA